MNRRSFLLWTGALPLVGVPVPEVEAPSLPPREFHRYIRETDSWVKIDGKDIKAGDVLRVFDPPDGYDEVVLVSRNDYENDQFFSTHKIDKATNEWVDYDLGD